MNQIEKAMTTEKEARALRLEFFTVLDRVNGKVLTWRLRLCTNGPIVLRSTEKWLRLDQALADTGALFKLLFADQFEVHDLRRSKATKIQAGPCKSPARSSKAEALPTPARSGPARRAR